LPNRKTSSCSIMYLRRRLRRGKWPSWAGWCLAMTPSLGIKRRSAIAQHTFSHTCLTTMASGMSFGDANRSFVTGIINGEVNTTFNLPPGKLVLQEDPRSTAGLTVAPPRTTRDPAAPVYRDTIRSRHRFRRERGIRSDSKEMRCTRFTDCTCWSRWRWVSAGHVDQNRQLIP